ncbi:MAG: tRNA (adenosine(37)-N6)-threonylcarbamoyltransferase complex transferase subunit TsaD, partial [Clostridia bacterium]|nr:tRNA (adenosine(37)-N6)-threonylcarbamoyltransferase complex transferase subunit TsaD [Clostridia bacterium]
INYVHTKEQRGETWSKADVACSFQHAALDILVEKAIEAAREKGVRTIAAGGGVIANGYLRDLLLKTCADEGIRLVLPERRHCTDNAAMIAAEGLLQYRAGNFSELSLNAQASIPLR